MKKFLGLLGMVGLLVVLSGVACCTKPPEELATAKDAVKKAENACAADYVKAELEKAKETLAKAEARYETGKRWKKCTETKELSMNTIELARKAEQDALAEKEKAKKMADEAIAMMEKCIEKAKAAEANVYAKDEFNRALAKFDEAKKLYASDECKYYQVKEMVEEAHKTLKNSIAIAKAEKERIAEEKRKAEEAARRAAEEELKRHPREWTVVKGECLWKIAGYEKIYGDPFQWPLIYKANKAQIKDPDLIYPGQVFKIPRNVPEEEVQQAIKEAKNRPWPVENFLFDGK